MKLRTEVSAERLRGGFYTPPALVAHTLQRVRSLIGTQMSPVRVLEPSVGDGAFIAGLDASEIDVAEVVGIEVLPSEAGKASERLDRSGLQGTIVTGSAISWALRPHRPFDVVVSNLPFVRFQFIDDADRVDSLVLGELAELPIKGVANLWLPMLLASLRHLRPGGVFAVILPAECFTGISAGSAREWLLRETRDLRCDLYPAGSFPAVLQEVVVLSGRLGGSGLDTRPVTFAHHAQRVSHSNFDDELARIDTHQMPVATASWTSLFLSRQQLDSFREFQALPVVKSLGGVARIGVAAVTGANEFFSLTSAEVNRYSLEPWARPLLPRTRHVQGLAFRASDHAQLLDSETKAFLFDARMARINLAKMPGLAGYLAQGEREGLPARYKCRIRSPWYAIPHIKHGPLLLSKRSHRFPRLLLNESEAVTTDTIYCGSPLSQHISAKQLVAGFQNSGTLLSAELEGRNFGGGVLELVPSEVGRLAVPLVPSLAGEFVRLDQIARSVSSADESDDLHEALTWETDLLLAKADVGITPRLMDDLAGARQVLMSRRLDRSSSRSA